MNKKIITIILVALAVMAGTLSIIFRASAPENVSALDASRSVPQDRLSRVTARLGGEEFSLMVARTEDEQTLGLSGFPTLAQNEGMIFPYGSDDSYGFWMKDMLFPIDIIWIDVSMRVVWVEGSVSPDTYPSIFFPSAPARGVIELSAGTAERLGLSVGSLVETDASPWQN
jgi:hypothetical protein